MQTLEIWEIHEWDGGARHFPKGKVLATQELAKQYSEKYAHDIVYPKCLIILEDLSELEEVRHAEVRKRALAKLDPLERHVLGIKE